MGRTIGRGYRQYAATDKVDFAIPLATFGDNRKVKNVQFDDGMFVELRLIYAIPIPED